MIPRVLVVVEGGVVHNILADGEVEAMLLDYDNDDEGRVNHFKRVDQDPETVDWAFSYGEAFQERSEGNG